MEEKDIYIIESEQINLKKIFTKYLRFWYLFIVSILICLGAAYLYLLSVTPEYYISSTLLIKDNKKQGNEPLSTDYGDSELSNYSQNLKNEIEVLKSKGLMEKVIKDLSLYTSYFVEDDFKEREIYGEELPLKVIVNKLSEAAYGKVITITIKNKNRFKLDDGINLSIYEFGKKIKTPYGVFTVIAAPEDSSNMHRKVMVKFHDTLDLALSYSNMLSITTIDKDASVISVGLTNPVPEKGKDIINKLVELYNYEAINEKKAIAANSLAFLDGRLKYLIRELTDVEENVERYKRQYEVMDVNSEAQLYLEKSTDYNRQLSTWNAQIDVLETIEQYLSRRENKNELVPSSLNIQDPTLQVLIKQFNELQLERQNYLRTMQASNPLVQDVNEQLANLQVNILENLRNIKKGLVINRDNLQRSYAKIESKKQQVPSIERELLDINREQGTKEGLYLYLLKKREESALSLAANFHNAKVIDVALVHPEPVSPRKKLIYIVAFLLGIGLPVAFINIKELANDKVQFKKDIEDLTNTPILGEISHDNKGDIVVVTSKNRSPVAELFRLIRANLQFATVGSENKVILITSSMGGEGKTFFSINLAASLVLTGKKVVVVGFDLRKPALVQGFGISNENGITNYLISNDLPIDDILIPLEQTPDLYLIGSGPIPPNPSEIMLHPKVGTMIDQLRGAFDYVIIDTAPVGQVADALALSPHIDSSIYIVRYNYTSKEQVQIIDDIYINKKLKHPMIVLNDAKKQNGYGYGYGYGYGNMHDPTWNTKFRKKTKV
ncbi:GumC family protein [Pontibacter vulgaris]|uniref:GumC family protein n=1 Tax=Pontibacter vulgaris TaxID=2905679 RepID=UPI001FA7BA47|nr:polysaccharide biosynthesis tyrosine autokinase [Pontibacter vulgaris]